MSIHSHHVWPKKTSSKFFCETNCCKTKIFRKKTFQRKRSNFKNFKYKNVGNPKTYSLRLFRNTSTQKRKTITRKITIWLYLIKLRCAWARNVTAQIIIFSIFLFCLLRLLFCAHNGGRLLCPFPADVRLFSWRERERGDDRVGYTCTVAAFFTVFQHSLHKLDFHGQSGWASVCVCKWCLVSFARAEVFSIFLLLFIIDSLWSWLPISSNM